MVGLGNDQRQFMFLRLLFFARASLLFTGNKKLADNLASARLMMSTKKMITNNEQVDCCFCYGSLRPDDDSGMPWTKEAVKGMRGQPATVPKAKLFMDRFAALVFDDDATQAVVGWVLTSEQSFFQEKMNQFDAIEGYEPDGSGLYQRAVVNVCLGDPTKSIGVPIGEKNTVVRAYVYHRPNCSKELQIESGDWLRREENYS